MTNHDNPFSKAEEIWRDLHGATVPKPVSPSPPPSFNPQWKYASTLTVRQAAFLWGGIDPKGGIVLFDNQKPNDYDANFQMLIAAIHTGKIEPVFRKYGKTGIFGPDEADQLSRQSLVTFAKETGQLPSFLFDTLPDAAISVLNIDEGVTDSKDSSGPSYVEKEGGSPADYHWDKIAALAVYLEGTDGLDSGVMAMCRQILDQIKADPDQYRKKGHKFVPDQTTIYRHLVGLLQAFDEIRIRKNAEKMA